MSIEHNELNPERGKSGKSFWRRLTEKFHRNPSSLIASDLPLIRESAAIILAKTSLPDRQVSLADISIYNLPINFEATRRLALAINEIKETPVDRFELSQFRPSPAVYEAIPWAASTIANHYNSEIPVILPNKDDIAAMQPWLRDISRLIGRFSESLQYRFGRFIEKKADKRIEEATGNILRRVDLIGEIDRPRAKFIPEITSLYQKVTEPEFVEDESFYIEDIFGMFDEKPRAPKMVRIPIETKVSDLVISLISTRDANPRVWINRESYPLLARALEISKFPPDSVDEGTAGIVGSEIMSGIEEFLRRQGAKELIDTPRAVKTFDLFDGNTWGEASIMRSLAETFKWEQIQAVKRSLPNLLTEVQNLLPESGPEVVESIRILSENVLILSKQGISNAEIASALFRKPNS